jgi:hypothetical protein
MKLLHTLVIACALGGVSSSHAAVDENAPSLGQTVRLAHEALGCTSYELLQRFSIAVARQNDEETLTKIAAEGCRPYTTMHGEVTDSKGGMVCILGLGNTRCLWFPSSVIEPAKPF